MTLARLAEQRHTRPAEQRANWPSGYGYGADFSSIPPPGLFATSHAGQVVNQHTMLQVDVIFTGLRILSNTVIRMGDLLAYQRKSNSDNVSYRVFLPEQPPILSDTWGGRMLQSTGRSRTILSMALFGEAFWYVLERSASRGAQGSVLALDVLNPAFMEVKQDKQGNLVYIYGAGSNKRELDPGDVIHIPLMSLPESRRALSPQVYAGISTALALAAYEFGASWFSQGASPDFILSTEQKLGQEEVARIASKFVIEHGGANAAHLPLVLDRGLKADKVMASPDESQYLNTLEYARSVIGSWIGIPASWLGNALQRLTPPAPGSLEDEMVRFQQLTLSGYTVPFEEATSNLLPAGEYATFDEGKLNRPNAASIAALATSLRQAQAGSVNDIRVRVLEWPPVPGGDEVMAPLASNVAPDTPKPAPDEKPVVPEPASRSGQLTLNLTVNGTDVTVEPSTAELRNEINVPEQKPPDVYVAAPEVTVAAPHVEIHTPEVRNEVTVQAAQAPDVHVDAPAITVEAPNVTVEAPAVTVQAAEPRSGKVKRDKNGQIVGVEYS